MTTYARLCANCGHPSSYHHPDLDCSVQSFDGVCTCTGWVEGRYDTWEPLNDFEESLTADY